MIAIDTNVLLRRLLDDDVIQCAKIRRLFQKSEKILIPDVVLVETIWTLKGDRYAVPREVISDIIHGLLAEPNLVFESEQAIWAALNDFKNAEPIKTKNGTRILDFPDALIINKAKYLIYQWGEPYEGTYTFDQAAQHLNGAKNPSD